MAGRVTGGIHRKTAMRDAAPRAVRAHMVWRQLACPMMRPRETPRAVADMSPPMTMPAMDIPLLVARPSFAACIPM